LMDKKKCSNFTRVLRGFALKGGTVIALAHTNKNPGRNGKPQYGGVGDIINDFDCGYIMTLHAATDEKGQRVVEFENIKRRGNVLEHVAYSYCAEPGIPYVETLLSVQPYDLQKLEPLKHAQQLRSDAEIIDAITTSIKSGINTKMKLANSVAQHTGASNRSALQVIEKYAGNDPAIHKWTYSVRERGAQVFQILEAPPPAPPQKSLHL